MKVGVSTHIHVYSPLNLVLLSAIKQAGFETVELYCNHPHWPDYDKNSRRAEIAGYCLDLDLPINSVHTPFFRSLDHAKAGKWLSISSSNIDLRLEAVERINESIAIAEHAPVEAAVIHLGSPDEKEDGGTYDRVYYSIEEILPIAKELNVKLALENITNDFSRGYRIARFIEESGLTGVGSCYDCGHATIYNRMLDELSEMAPHLITTHIHDTTEGKDNHLHPFDGEIDWEELAGKIADLEYSGDLIIETKDATGSDDEIKKAAAAGERFRDMILG